MLENPSEGLVLKTKYEKEVSLHEVFLEAVPSSLVITVIMMTASADNYYLNGDPVPNIEGDPLERILFGKDGPEFLNLFLGDTNFFYLTFCTSVLSASLGLAKCLLVGPARVMTRDGPLSGLLSGRFLMAFLASASILLSKGVLLGFVVAHTEEFDGTILSLEYISTFLFFPNIIFSSYLVLSFNRHSMMIIVNYPSFLLMPVFTLFTFSKIKIGCCQENGEKDEKIAFSPKFTILNIIINIL